MAVIMSQAIQISKYGSIHFIYCLILTNLYFLMEDPDKYLAD